MCSLILRIYLVPHRNSYFTEHLLRIPYNIEPPNCFIAFHICSFKRNKSRSPLMTSCVLSTGSGYLENLLSLPGNNSLPIILPPPHFDTLLHLSFFYQSS